MGGRDKQFLHAEDEKKGMEKLRDEFFPLSERAYTKTQLCTNASATSKQNRPHQVRVSACDYEQEPIPAGSLD